MGDLTEKEKRLLTELWLDATEDIEGLKKKIKGQLDKNKNK